MFDVFQQWLRGLTERVNEFIIMLNSLSASQRALASYMSELSEEAYSAGWIADCEHTLWRAVVDGPRDFGRLVIRQQHIARLKRLSDECGGWICFDTAAEETFVEIRDWIENRYMPHLGE